MTDNAQAAVPQMPIAVFDVDGTLFDPAHRRHFVMHEPKDWDAFFDPSNVILDSPKPQVVAMARRYAMTHEIHIVTARREADRDITVRQLRGHGIPFAALHIVRPDGERKPDGALKREWLEDFAGRSRIDFVVDDRASLCAMWRAQGLFCFQVDAGAF